MTSHDSTAKTPWCSNFYIETAGWLLIIALSVPVPPVRAAGSAVNVEAGRGSNAMQVIIDAPDFTPGASAEGEDTPEPVAAPVIPDRTHATPATPPPPLKEGHPFLAVPAQPLDLPPGERRIIGVNHLLDHRDGAKTTETTLEDPPEFSDTSLRGLQEAYYKRYPDVRASVDGSPQLQKNYGEDFALWHYLKYGREEGRNASFNGRSFEDFENYYRKKYGLPEGDPLNPGLSPLFHHVFKRKRDGGK